MSEDRQPLDMALDLLFYAPLGLAVTAAEEVPKLAEKGRRQFTSRWNTARMVGQFAVAQGRQQAARRFASPPDAPRPSSATPEAAPPEAVTAPVAAPEEEQPTPEAPAGGRPPAVSPAPAGSDGAGPDGAVPRADELAIPGYDSLSASQVVQRLAGLSPSELDAVRRYEAGTRGRRTILTRVAQLQEP